jgi:hypothetical protein
MTVRDIIAEPLECQQNGGSRKQHDERVREIAEKCKLSVEHLRRVGEFRHRYCAPALVSFALAYEQHGGNTNAAKFILGEQVAASPC